MPNWSKASLIIFMGIAFGVWHSGEYTRRLDAEFLVESMRYEMQRSTVLLAGLVSEAVLGNDQQTADAIIKEYIIKWPEISYVHIMDDKGFLFTEWQKKPITFGEGILKFEAPVEYGGQNYGTLSLYIDLNNFFTAMEDHISSTRRTAASILLSITLVLLFFVNYAAASESRQKKDENNGQD